MTFRARPVRRTSGRSGWNSGDRRTLLLNLGFVAAIVVSILILVGFAGFSWYNDHFGAAATVNGVTITRDQLRTRYAIDSFRIDYTESQIRTLQNAGRMTEANATSQISYLEQQRQSLTSLSLERLIDAELQSQLASVDGITVTESDIDAQMVEEATTPEERHVWVIEVTPENDPATGVPGDAEKAAAKAKADQALAQLKAGTSWEDVSKTVSTSTTAVQDGDLGWLAQASGYDEPFMTATFAINTGEYTDVIEGDDGVYRIGRVTEIAPSTVDPTFQDRLAAKDVSLADYRQAVRVDLVRKKLSDKVVADLSQPGPQRHVLQIYLPVDSGATTDSVKVRHILFSPNHDPTAASSLAADDPAWATAQADAEAAYAALQADPSKFDEMARTMSDDSGSAANGGKLPFYDPTSSLDPAFSAAIFASGLQPGQLIPPFKSSFGWHVVQFMRPYGDGDEAWLNHIRDEAIAGTDFAQLARDQGEGPEAAQGGDLGWVARGQFDSDKESAIFSAPIGSVSDVDVAAGDGVYLFKVLAEETRTPTKAQIAIFQSTGFSDWYSARKADAKITRSGTATTTTE